MSDVFDEIDVGVAIAKAMAQLRMAECEVLQDQANLIAERIGTERAVDGKAFLGARDGAIYEARAEAAQKKAGQAASWERLAEELAQRRWERLT